MAHSGNRFCGIRFVVITPKPLYFKIKAEPYMCLPWWRLGPCWISWKCWSSPVLSCCLNCCDCSLARHWRRRRHCRIDIPLCCLSSSGPDSSRRGCDPGKGTSDVEGLCTLPPSRGQLDHTGKSVRPISTHHKIKNTNCVFGAPTKPEFEPKKWNFFIRKKRNIKRSILTVKILIQVWVLNNLTALQVAHVNGKPSHIFTSRKAAWSCRSFSLFFLLLARRLVLEGNFCLFVHW